MTETPDSPQTKPPSPLDRIVEQRLKDREARGVTSDTPPKLVATGNIHKEIRRMKQDSQQLGHAAKVRRKHRTAPSGFGGGISLAQQLYNEMLQEKSEQQRDSKYTPEELFDKLSSLGHIYHLGGRGNAGLLIFRNEDGEVAHEMKKLGVFDKAPPGTFTKSDAVRAIKQNPAVFIAMMPQHIPESEARLMIEELEKKGHISVPDYRDIMIDSYASAATSDTLTPIQKEEFLAAFNSSLQSKLTPIQLTKENVERTIREHWKPESSIASCYTHLLMIREALPNAHPVNTNIDQILHDHGTLTIQTQAMIDAVEKTGVPSGKKNIHGKKVTVVNRRDLTKILMAEPQHFEHLSNDSIALTPKDIVLGLIKRGHIYDVIPADESKHCELRVRGKAAEELLQNLGLTLESRKGEATKAIPEAAIQNIIGPENFLSVMDSARTMERMEHHVSFQR